MLFLFTRIFTLLTVNGKFDLGLKVDVKGVGRSVLRLDKGDDILGLILE